MTEEMEIHIQSEPLRSYRNGLLNFFKACHCRDWRRKLVPGSASTVLRQTVDEREEISLPVSSLDDPRRSFPVNFIKKIDFDSLIQLCGEWIKHPMNIALILWSMCVAVSSSMQGLLLLGLLDEELPEKSSRNRWMEINNQVLNALFTLMSLYQHPSLFHHLVLLCRWRSQDIVDLRKIYCKNGARRSWEWAHMMVVVLLLHITCFSQYILCGLYWGYTIATRPEFSENFFNAAGFVAPVFAGAYAMYSPLGREYHFNSKEEECESEDLDLNKHDRVSVSQPEWKGGLFDCFHDSSVGSLSFFCSFCVYGWNLERLGFGNMYVHSAMFFLLCFAPLWIFGVSAFHISDGVISKGVAIAGFALSLCGLLYGGFWRLRMRRRFNLAGGKLCCGSETATDYFQWLFCCACSLAQEIRTGNFYDVEDGRFYMKSLGGEEDRNLLGCPVPRENRGGVILEMEQASMSSITSKGSAVEQDNCGEVSAEMWKPHFQQMTEVV
ncbi:hypothetical protein KSP39_PZI006718 [Platanthera zijinensis]|uniref:PLAC8 family protein n=1 Tax=Platanthera zijinensis TaxID=2320716 RepID=A0AAP0BQG8_9ASPA